MVLGHQSRNRLMHAPVLEIVAVIVWTGLLDVASILGQFAAEYGLEKP